MMWLAPKNSMSSSARRPNWRAAQRPVSRPSASITIASPCATPAPPAAAPLHRRAGRCPEGVLEVPGTKEDIEGSVILELRWSMSSTCLAPEGHPGPRACPAEAWHVEDIASTARCLQPVLRDVL